MLFDLVDDSKVDGWEQSGSGFFAEWIKSDDVMSAVTGDLHTFMYEVLVTEHIDKESFSSLIPQSQLPVELPLDIANYKPKGKSPLEDHATFPRYVSENGNVYQRECDTLDTFMCSSFYYLRYPDAHNADAL